MYLLQQGELPSETLTINAEVIPEFSWFRQARSWAPNCFGGGAGGGGATEGADDQSTQHKHLRLLTQHRDCFVCSAFVVTVPPTRLRLAPDGNAVC